MYLFIYARLILRSLNFCSAWHIALKGRGGVSYLLLPMRLLNSSKCGMGQTPSALALRQGAKRPAPSIGGARGRWGFHSPGAGAASSQVEGQFVKVHIARDGADLGAEARDLIGKHAGCWDLDGVVPVVVVVAQGVGEVEDGHLGDLGRVLRHVEMRRLDTTLRD